VQITFKLFASLSDYLPRELDGRARTDHQIAVEVPEATPVQGVIDRFHLPPALVHLVLVNGLYVAPSQRSTHQLRDGDALAVWPPIAGG
jgi:sulfur carrier protein ThiS